jgi:DNA repair exonuclease SbcCD nuclease subunit
MRLAAIADVHVGNHNVHKGAFASGLNERCRLTVDTLRAATMLAFEREAELVVCGDLFHTERPTPQVVAAVQRALEHARTICLVGNHDRVSDAAGDHALASLAPVAEIIEEPEVVPLDDGVDLVCVPFMPGDAREWFPGAVREAVKTSAQKRRLLAIHLGVQDDQTSHFLRGAHDSIDVATLSELMGELEIEFCFAGNWHDHRTWATVNGRVVQLGALNPTGWSNAGTRGYGTVAIWDSEQTGSSVELVELPGPRFIDVGEDEPDVEDELRWLKERGDTVYLRSFASGEFLPAAQEDVDTWKHLGLVHAGGAFPVKGSVEEAAREAAAAARSADSLEEALAGFIKTMELEDESIRGEVLERVRGLMGGVQ